MSAPRLFCLLWVLCWGAIIAYGVSPDVRRWHRLRVVPWLQARKQRAQGVTQAGGVGRHG